MSKRQVKGGDSETLLGLLKSLRLQNCGSSVKIAVIQEVGMEGFWLHRLLENAGIESWLVDPGSIATSRRSRRVKTDRIDGEALIAKPAFVRGKDWGAGWIDFCSALAPSWSRRLCRNCACQ
jgi:transposase